MNLSSVLPQFQGDTQSLVMLTAMHYAAASKVNLQTIDLENLAFGLFALVGRLELENPGIAERYGWAKISDLQAFSSVRSARPVKPRNQVGYCNGRSGFRDLSGWFDAGAIGSYWTVKTYYLKRQDEQRDRQRQELERVQAERQAELDKYAESKKREYAAERDFGHLMRQYDALNLNLTTIHEFQEKRAADIEDDLRMCKGMLQLVLIHIGQTDTGIARYLDRE